jgi:hypothetical protein
MKLQQKIFGIGLLTAVIVPHLYEKGYSLGYVIAPGEGKVQNKQVE